MRRDNSPLEGLATVVAAHGALTELVADTSRMMKSNGLAQYAAHLDTHRAELNVAIGELAMWLNSFGEWGHLDPVLVPHPGPGETPPKDDGGPFEAWLLAAREALKARRARLMTDLATARSALDRAGLPSGELTAYRRVLRLWAGEAIDVVASVHRLTAADRCIRRLAELGTDAARRRDAADLLRRWMDDLQAVDREAELALAESCGHGELVRWYRQQAI